MKGTVLVLAVLLLAAGCPKKNLAPDTPLAPIGPSVVPKDSIARFCSVATDPDGDSVCIRFDWGDGATSGWSNWVASGDTVTMSHLWVDSGTFQLKTQAKDRQDLTSAWSAALAVSVTSNHPPNTPAVPSGPSAAPKDSVCQFTTTVTDPDGDSVSVRFSWGDGDTSQWSAAFLSGDTARATHAWQDPGGYQLKAQARDKYGLTSDWSSSTTVSITRLRWRCKTAVSAGASPAIAADGTVYIPSVALSGGNYYYEIFAINPDGSPRWQYKAPTFITSSPAVAADGTVYLATDTNSLYAINADGSFKWRFRASYLDRAIFATPAIATDGTIHLGFDDQCLYALNADGSFKWRCQAGHGGGPHNSSPAVAADGTVYVGSKDSCLYAVNPDGSLKWRYRTGDYVHSSPAVAADGAVFVGSDDHYLYAINPDSSLKWRYQTGNCIFSSPALAADGTIYVGSEDSCLYAVSPDGLLKWRYHTGGQVNSSPAIAADGTVYVGSSDHNLYAINPAGSVRWSYQTDNSVSSSPAVAADGTVYVGSGDGCLYAIVGDSPLADSPWPKFHHDNKNTGRVGGGQR